MHSCYVSPQILRTMLLLLLLPDPFQKMGAWQKTMELEKSGNSPRAWTRGGRETESHQRASGAKSS